MTRFKSIKLTLLASAALTGIMFSTPQAFAVVGDDWSPRVTERLIRLPSTYMVKAIDQDFRASGLATRLDDLTLDISLKHRTLAELQSAIDQAEGDVVIELKHQFLAEKKALIELMSEQRDLQSDAVDTRVRLYERLIQRMDHKAATMTASDRELEQQRAAAQERMNATLDKVDIEVLGRATVEESQYQQEYAEKQAALNRLLAAYDNHRMNTDPIIDGQSLDKRSYLQVLISDAQKEAALLDQQSEIIIYMARLVALDAMALSEEVLLTSPETGVIARPEPINETVEFFLTQY